jgi:ComF family protein
MTTKNSLNKAGAFLLDLIFPKFCLGCQKEGEWICKKCQKEIVFIKNPSCPNCQRLTKNGKFCPRCRPNSYLTGLIVAAHYQEGVLKEAIHTFKYEGVFDLKEELGKILAQRLERFKQQKQVIIIPVPLHKKRLRERGYNQAELLAKEIIKFFPNFTLKNNLLIKTKQPKHTQVELSGQKRRKNVHGCFSINKKHPKLKSSLVILVDDIYTTGATLQECAKVIRKNCQVKEIWGLVLAKA